MLLSAFNKKLFQYEKVDKKAKRKLHSVVNAFLPPG